MSVSAAVRIWPKSKQKGKNVEENGRRMRDFASRFALRALAAILFSVDFGHIRTAVETEVPEKLSLALVPPSNVLRMIVKLAYGLKLQDVPN